MNSYWNSATKIKRIADKTTDKKEACELYIRAGLDFMIGSRSYEIAMSFERAAQSYSETAHYFKRIVRICKENNLTDFVSLCVRCEAVALARKCILDRHRIRNVCETTFHTAEDAVKNSSSTIQQPPSVNNGESAREDNGSDIANSTGDRNNAGNGGLSTISTTSTNASGPPVLLSTLSSSKRESFYRDIMDMITYFEAFYRIEQLFQQHKKEEDDFSLSDFYDIPHLIEYVKKRL